MKYTGTNTTLIAFEASGDYNNEDNFTDAQKETILSVIDKYKFIEGNYSSTMIQGVGHAYCDSGILSDGWAVEDVEILSKYLREEVEGTDESVFYGTDIVNCVGDDIIAMHTDGKRTHRWDTLFIADMDTALGNDKYDVEGVNVDELGKGKYEGYIDIEAWASYAWDLESYMYDNK